MYDEPVLSPHQPAVNASPPRNVGRRTELGGSESDSCFSGRVGASSARALDEAKRPAATIASVIGSVIGSERTRPSLRDARTKASRLSFARRNRVSSLWPCASLPSAPFC